MQLNEVFSVSPSKVELLKSRIRQLGIDLSKVEETFARGSGKGGQKRNKTSNAVTLYYAPLDLTAKSDRERQRNLNRFLALRDLVDQIEMRVSPGTSQVLKSWQKIRKQKDRRARRSKES